MDDDFTFGASVWASNDPVNALPPQKSLAATESQFGNDDRFDDFCDPVDTVRAGAGDDDFGDFGDFEEVEANCSSGFGDDLGFEEDVRIAGPSSASEWHTLKLDPSSLTEGMNEELQSILSPIWGYENLANILASDGIREIEGVNQILVDPESRNLYKMLVQTPPPTKPPNWTRSRIRRQHLIALGIPVNLDEVLPHASGKPLPPLEITTRPMSAPPGTRNSTQNGVTSSNINSRAGTPQPLAGRLTTSSRFGPEPQLEYSKIQKLLELDPGTGLLRQDTLTIQPISTLEKHLEELRVQTTTASTLLTHLLQSREALRQDSETYNGLIAELVGEAQKMKSSKPSRTNSVRQNSRN
ncbi:hypothetical protein C0992_010467 [Termitomyces sp. T32_za158]|nr:hypothetical protein C0992_010467 [Termitomyces sp. T32_za158]